MQGRDYIRVGGIKGFNKPLDDFLAFAPRVCA